MFYSSRNSKNKVFHYQTCQYAKRLSPERRIAFYTINEAKAAGYSHCSCCSVIGRQYRRCRKDVMSFCAEHGFIHFFHDGELYVISADDTAWRICCDLKKGKKKVLLHESKDHVLYERRGKPYTERKYHVQNTKSTDIMGYLVYILGHDRVDKERDEKRKLEKALQIEAGKSSKALRKMLTRKQRKHMKHRPVEPYGGVRRRSNQQLRAFESPSSDYWLDYAAYL